MFYKLLKYLKITLPAIILTLIITNIIVVTTTINSTITEDSALTLDNVDYSLLNQSK